MRIVEIEKHAFLFRKDGCCVENSSSSFLADLKQLEYAINDFKKHDLFENSIGVGLGWCWGGDYPCPPTQPNTDSHFLVFRRGRSGSYVLLWVPLLLAFHVGALFDMWRLGLTCRDSAFSRHVLHM